MLEYPVDLSVVIVSFNTRDLTLDCLRSIYEGTHGIVYEIFVVDNNSTDGSADAIEERFPQVHLIRNLENKGLASATNQGLEQSRGRYVVALNSDTVIQPGAFYTLVRFMDHHPEVGGATPRLILPNGADHPIFCGAPPSFKSQLLVAISPLSESLASASYRMRFGYPLDLEKTQEVPCILWGSCFIVRRKAMEQVGMQDPGFFVYGEDVDWSLRISKAGWKLYYVSEAQVIHYGGQSTKQSSVRMHAQLWKSICLLIGKHEGKFRGCLLRLVVASICGLRAMKWIVLYGVRSDVRQKALARIREMYAIMSAVLSR